MRWDRLFADLEGQAADIELEERDALVSEIRDGEWAATPWRDLVGGRVVLQVAGLGRVEGAARLVNETIVHLTSARAEHVVATAAVLEVTASEGRAPATTAVTSRLGWAHLLRAARNDGDRAILTRTDGAVVDGTVEVVGRDFVTVRTGAERTRVVPFAALAALTLSAT